jgi:tetratricopeptide (TPR) repeat protein
VLVLAAALFFYGLFYMTKRSDAYKAARGWVSQNQQVRAAVGGRIDEGPDMTSFNVKSSGDTGSADMTFSVRGPGGSTEVRVLLIKERGAWRVIKAAYLDSSGRPVMLDLREKPRAKIAKKRAPPKKSEKKPEEEKPDPGEQARAHIDTAHRLFGQKRYTDSVREYSKAIEMDPKNAKAYYWRGIAYIKQKETPRGLSDMKQAVALDPKNARAHEYLGWLYGSMGRYAKATSHFTRVIELKPRYGKGYFQRGAAYFKRGDAKRGMKDMEKACGLGYKPGCDAMLSFRKAI